jgi:hypothetical protein
MRIAQGLIGLLALLGWTRVANAQFFFPSTTGFNNVAPGRTFSSTSFRHHHHFSAHRYYSFGLGYYPYNPFFDSAFYSPGFFGYSFAAAPSGSPIVFNLPAPHPNPPPPAGGGQGGGRRQVEEELPKGKVLIKPGQQKAKEEAKPELPLPGVEASKFRPIGVADRERALQPVVPEEAMPQGPPKPVEEHPTEEPLPQPVEPASDPKDFVRLGKEVFAAREYGRSERFFRKASMNEPKEPFAFFLLAQARFALGKYQEAVEAIHAGMRLKADWPQSDFQPLPFYGSHPADFQKQLDHLKGVAANYPNDPALAFLYGYQLWFAGRKEEAKPSFQRAEADAKEREFVSRFLPDRQRPAPTKN